MTRAQYRKEEEMNDRDEYQPPGEWLDAGGFTISTVNPPTRSQRRRGRNRLWVDWVLHRYGWVTVWTPAQRVAVWLFYEKEANLVWGAKISGVTHQAFHERLKRAEDKALRAYEDRAPRPRELRGRPNAHLTLDGSQPEPVIERAPASLVRYEDFPGEGTPEWEMERKRLLRVEKWARRLANRQSENPGGSPAEGRR
jgi:hypothetical protein